MLMKEFERTENDLEHKVTEAQRRFDAEQAKVSRRDEPRRLRNSFVAISAQ